MIDSQSVLYNKVGNDESYTPDYGVKPILKYIPKDVAVWCPFDTEQSEFVKQIQANGNKVLYSHINNDQDFFTYEPDEHWDIIISNPPFKGKRKFFERAMEFNKPFALLMTLTMFNDKYPAYSFYENNLTMQLLKFDQRIEFIREHSKEKKITFQSGYICNKLLPTDLIIEPLNKPKGK